MKDIDKIKYFPLLIFILTLLMSIGYASVSELIVDLGGEISARQHNGVFIVSVDVVNDVDNVNDDNSLGTVYFVNGTNMNSKTELTNINESFITYNITVHNNSTELYVFDGVKYLNGEESVYDNDTITYEIVGLNIGDLVDIGVTKTFSIVFHYVDYTYVDNNVLNSYLNFDFKSIDEVLNYELFNKITGETSTLTDTFEIYTYDICSSVNTSVSSDNVIFTNYNANEYYVILNYSSEPVKVLIENNFYTRHNIVYDIIKFPKNFLNIIVKELDNYNSILTFPEGNKTIIDFSIEEFKLSSGEILSVPSLVYHDYDKNGKLIGSSLPNSIWIYDEFNKTFILSTENTVISENLKIYVDKQGLLFDSISNFLDTSN